MAKENIDDFLKKALYQPEDEEPEVSSAITARIILKTAQKLGLKGKLYEAAVAGESHIYVVLDNMTNPEFPLNGIKGIDIRVGYVRSSGKDVTEEVMNPKR